MVEHPSRRALLLALTVAGVATSTAGCTSRSSGTTAARARPGADELAVNRAIADATRLRASALSLSERYSAVSGDRALYLGMAADHLAHLSALGAPATAASASPSSASSASPQASASPDASTSPSASPSLDTSPSPDASASPSASPSPASPSLNPSVSLDASPSPSASAGTSAPASATPDSPANQLDAEWTAAGNALRLGLDAGSGGLAQLMVRIAAARAAHADLIAASTRKRLPGVLIPESVPAASPSGPATGSPTGSATTPVPTPATTSAAPSPGSVLASPTDRALNRLLAGEHAAVYAYPVVIARTSGAERKQAQAWWADHRYTRDVLTTRLLSAGVEPEDALPAYRISPVPSSAGQAAQLGATIERGLTALAADVVATAETGADRTLGADALVVAARRTATWAGRSDALPGGTAPKVGSTPAASPEAGPAVTASATAG